LVGTPTTSKAGFLSGWSMCLRGVWLRSDASHLHVRQFPPQMRQDGRCRVAISSFAIAPARSLAASLGNFFPEHPSILHCCRRSPRRLSGACSTMPRIRGGAKASSRLFLRAAHLLRTLTGLDLTLLHCLSANGPKVSAVCSLWAYKQSFDQAWMATLPDCYVRRARYATASKQCCLVALKSPVCLCSMSAKLNSPRHWPHQLPENSAGPGCVRPPRRAVSDVIQIRCRVRNGRKRITQPHRPCLAQTACACSSVANSPLRAAALERATASRSSGEVRGSRPRTFGWPGQARPLLGR
jgi:hypothetical protein